MSLRSKLNELERRIVEVGEGAEDCPRCRNWIAVVGNAREDTPEFRTCPNCGRVRTGPVIIIDGYTPELAQ